MKTQAASVTQAIGVSKPDAAVAEPAPSPKPVDSAMPGAAAPRASLVDSAGTPDKQTDANADGTTESESDAEDEAEEPVEEQAPKPAARRRNALARQAASVQKQIGHGHTKSAFFISSWFSDAPSPSAMASLGAVVLPGGVAAQSPADCDPLEKTIAEAYIRDSAKREGVNTDLIREVVRKESGFNPCAVSAKGAMGMMQLTPETAKSLGVDDPFDPRQNIDGGVRLLKRLLEKYKGRPDLALAAYNAGEGAVDANQGVPAYEETKEYVSTIMKRVFEEKPQRSRPTMPNPPEKILPPKIPSTAPIPTPKPPAQ